MRLAVCAVSLLLLVGCDSSTEDTESAEISPPDLAPTETRDDQGSQRDWDAEEYQDHNAQQLARIASALNESDTELD